MAKRGSGTKAAGSPAKSAAAPQRKQQVISFRVAEDLYERFLNTVDALSGPPERLTYTSFGAAAIADAVTRLEKKHHNGKPFPPRPK